MNLELTSYRAGVQTCPTFYGGVKTMVDLLPLKTRGRIVFYRAYEINWIEAKGRFVFVHVGAESHEVRKGINFVQHQLDPKQFIRIHRSTIVNIRSIREIRTNSRLGAIVVLYDGTELSVSQRYRPFLDEIFSETLG
jgi:two-component system LytT family response regulator